MFSGLKTILLAGLYALLVCFGKTATSQLHIDNEIKTGYLTESKIFDLGLLNDSLVVVGWNKENSSGSYQKYLTIYSAKDLKLKYTLSIGKSTPLDYGALSLTALEQGFIFTAIDYPDSIRLELYKLDQMTIQTSKLFSNILEKPYSLLNVNVLNNEVYAMIFNGEMSSDTTEILVFDLVGNLLRSKKDFIKSDYSNWDSTFHGPFYYGPYQHPTNFNSLVYGSGYECRIIEIDKQSLDIKYVMPREPIDIYYSSPHIYGYQLYDDKIVCGGSIQYLKDFQNSQFIGQSYYQSRAWNGDTLEKRRFGSLNVEEKAYAFYSDKSTATHFVGGAAPFDQFLPFAPEYRQMIIHRFNHFGTDSIVLYGNKNHVAYQIEKGNNDDLFILSVYNEAWTTDSSFIQITKIPGYAISLIEQKKVSPAIQLYPNPTHDYLIVEDLMGTPEKIEIYDQQGKLLLTHEINDEAKVDLRSLKVGLYVAVITSEDGSKYSAIVKKE